MKKALFTIIIISIFLITACSNLVKEDISYSNDQRSEEEQKAECKELGGTFNPCGSACTTDAEACISVCVPKCEFD